MRWTHCIGISLFAIAGLVLVRPGPVPAELDAIAESSDANRADAAKSFDRRVAPLLARRCLGCHSGDEPKGKLDLTSARTAAKGGATGPAIVAGKPQRSPLWKRIRDSEMPPKHPVVGE